MPGWETPGGFKVALRPARPEDESIIFHAWLLAHRESGDWPKRLSSRRYFAEHKVTIMKILARAQTVVACNADREWQVFGFIVFEKPRILHWVFVKQIYRREGIAKQLALEASQSLDRARLDTVCSHWTTAAAMLREHGWHLRFDPFIVENLS